MRRDVAARWLFTTDICNVSVAGDAGTRNSEGVNRDAPEGIPPSSTGFREQLKGIAEQGGWRKLDIVETPRGMVEGGCTAT